MSSYTTAIPCSQTHRIALITGLPLGGSTTFVLNLGRELVKRNIPVLVIGTEKEHPFEKDFSEAGIPVILINEKKLIYEDRISYMLALLKRFQPTTMIGCLGHMSYEIMRYAPKEVYRIGVIQTDHPVFYDALAPYTPYLDAVAGVSRSIIDHLSGMNEFRNVLRLELPYGVPMLKTYSPRLVHHRPLRIFYFGRLTNPQKRVYLFPKILKQLEQSDIPFHWTIAGDGEERAFLESKMITSRSDQLVTFLGSVINSEIPEILEQQDIMILPSEAEGLPLSLLEAMGRGVVPVVSNLKSGLAEVLDPSSGFLIPVEEIEGYARAIIHLHKNREELASKANAAKKRVENQFSSAAMTERWLATLPKNPPVLHYWSDSLNVKPPLGLEKSPRYRPIIRPLRRLIARLR